MSENNETEITSSALSSRKRKIVERKKSCLFKDNEASCSSTKDSRPDSYDTRSKKPLTRTTELASGTTPKRTRRSSERTKNDHSNGATSARNQKWELGRKDEIKKGIGLGVRNFKTRAVEKMFLVDKTDFVHELFHNADKVQVISKPRGWGKSTLLSTVETALEIEVNLETGEELSDVQKRNEQLFTENNFKLVKTPTFEKHFGKKIVVRLDFSRLAGLDVKSLRLSLIACIKTTYERFSFLPSHRIYQKFFDVTSEISQIELRESITSLVQALYAKYRKDVIILIDEYDTCFQHLQLLRSNNKYAWKEICELAADYYAVIGSSSTLDCVQRILMTGIISYKYLKTDKLFSDKYFLFTNVQDEGTCNPFNKYFGFNKFEVECLLNQCGVKEEVIRTRYINELYRWYGGYYYYETASTEEGTMVFNPFSIMRFLLEQEWRSYWKDIGGTAWLNKFLTREYLIVTINNLLYSKEITTELKFFPLDFCENPVDSACTPAAYTLLLRSGLLALQSNPSRKFVKLRIPNIEVELELRRKMMLNPNIYSTSNVRPVLEILRELQIDQLEEALKKYIRKLAMPQKRSEAVYHVIMSCLFQELTDIFTPFSETPSGDGIVDHLLMPVSGDTGIILEYKFYSSKNSKNVRNSMIKKAEETLKNQVAKKYYATTLKSNPRVKRIYVIVLIFGPENNIVMRYKTLSTCELK